MRIGVFAQPGSWYLQDLCRAATETEEIVPLDFQRIGSAVSQQQLSFFAASHTSTSDDSTIVELSDFDALLVRTMPPGSLEQVVLRMDILGALHEHGTQVINAPRAIEAAVDKFLTSHRLARAGLLTPETEAAQDWQSAMEAFQRLGKDVVVKPIFGGEGRGIIRVTDTDLAFRVFRALERHGEVIYLQRFIKHPGYDVRVFLIGDQAWCMERRNDLDWRTNVSRGATTRPFDASDELLATARQAAELIGADVAGVDLLPSGTGTWYVLEVNAVPGWKRLAETLDIDIARRLLDYLYRRCKDA